MALALPTRQARKGYDPGGFGAGLSAPYGKHPAYLDGNTFHNGWDFFWLSPESAARLGISQAQSYEVLPVVSGMIRHVNDTSLGTGLWQQIDATHRAYWWHLSSRIPEQSCSLDRVIGVMGNTGTAAGRSRHLHFEVRKAPYGFADRIDPTPWFRARAALEPHQRQVLATLPVRRRLQPTSQSPEAGEPLAPGEVGNFNGWIRGESVNGNNVWFRGISGHWFWSGGFTSTSTAGLADLNPAAPKPMRTIRDLTANVRNLPTTDGTTVVATLAADLQVEVQGYTRGKSVSQSGVTSDVWFRVAAGWAWSGSFTDPTPGSLPLLQSGLPANPGYQLDPTLWKDKTPDIPIAEWVGSPNFNYRAPVTPKTHFTEHWMAGTLAGTDAHFQIAGEVTKARLGTEESATFGVGQTEVHQYVKLEHYHHADGKAESNAAGVAVEHEGGPNAPITDAVYALSAKVHAEVMQHPLWGGGRRLVVGVNMHPHHKWVATTCPGTLDLERLARETNAILDELEKPEPEPEPEPTPDPDATPGWFVRFLQAIVEAITKFLRP